MPVISRPNCSPEPEQHLDCATDSVTICPGEDPIIVTVQNEVEVNITNQDTTLDVTAHTEYNEDNGHSSGDRGVFVLAVRNDVLDVVTSTNGDYSQISVDSVGAVRITNSSDPLEVHQDFLSSGLITIEDSPFIEGVSFGTPAWAVRNDAHVALTTADLNLSGIAVDADGAVQISDGGNSITVDGTVSVTEPVSVDDNGGSLTIDDGGGSITVDGTVTATVTLNPAGTLANGAETTVAGTAVSILAANGNRKQMVIQNTGVTNIRVGVAGVTATTGFQLIAGASREFRMPYCPTNEVFAIREGAVSSTALAQEVT